MLCRFASDSHDNHAFTRVEIRSHLFVQFLNDNYEGAVISDLQNLLCCRQSVSKTGNYEAKLYSIRGQDSCVLVGFVSEEEVDEFVRQCNDVRTGVDISYFHSIATIGRGKWGKVIVCSCQLKNSPELLVVKQIESSSQQQLKYVQDERLVLGLLPDHPFGKHALEIRFKFS